MQSLMASPLVVQLLDISTSLTMLHKILWHSGSDASSSSLLPALSHIRNMISSTPSVAISDVKAARHKCAEILAFMSASSVEAVTVMVDICCLLEVGKEEAEGDGALMDVELVAACAAKLRVGFMTSMHVHVSVASLGFFGHPRVNCVRKE